MCGRFIYMSPQHDAVELFEAVPANDLPEVPSYNVCPTDMVHLVVPSDAGRQLKSMRWGGAFLV